uniref:Uncharacterized protein n=1 Tax=Cucumis melo TaxID=3656 RepID=A0A9I9CFZ7_CUCME
MATEIFSSSIETKGGGDIGARRSTINENEIIYDGIQDLMEDDGETLRLDFKWKKRRRCFGFLVMEKTDALQRGINEDNGGGARVSKEGEDE